MNIMTKLDTLYDYCYGHSQCKNCILDSKSAFCQFLTAVMNEDESEIDRLYEKIETKDAAQNLFTQDRQEAV